MQLYLAGSRKGLVFESWWSEDSLLGGDLETIYARSASVWQSWLVDLRENPWIDWRKYLWIARSHWKKTQWSNAREYWTRQGTCSGVSGPNSMGWADRVISVATWGYLTEERPTISCGKNTPNGLEPLQAENWSPLGYFWTKNHFIRQKVTGAQQLRTNSTRRKSVKGGDLPAASKQHRD